MISPLTTDLSDLMLQRALERSGILGFIVEANARELCDASREIEDIHTYSWRAIAERLAANGARVDQLTVAELRCLARDEMESRREARREALIAVLLPDSER